MLKVEKKGLLQCEASVTAENGVGQIVRDSISDNNDIDRRLMAIT